VLLLVVPGNATFFDVVKAVFAVFVLLQGSLGKAGDTSGASQCFVESQARQNFILIATATLPHEPTMVKRQALEPLEDVVDAPSPAMKRAKVEDEEMESPPSTNGGTSNGHLMSPRQQDRDRVDIMGAYNEEHEELEEAGALDDDDEAAVSAPRRQAAPEEGYTDLYLDTIDRKVLDFDFEKLCSVTLSNINVYACLVCGKYYQGRGPKSQAYFHALEEGHHVYVNMETKKVYVLPEGYEVMSKSLEDIKFVVDPRMNKDEVARLDREPKVSWDLLNKEYIPGFVGMNNIKANDYFNVVVQALAHVVPLRNYFMLEDLSARPQLAQRFSTLVRKIWNPRAFKSHVSPHELLQEIALRSSKRFSLTDQSDPVDFLSWFLNHLHLAVGGSKTKPNSSIIQKVFQGTMKIESQEITARADAGDRLRFEDAAVKTETSKFLVLTLDLPAAPLFQDALERNMIPQVPLTTILNKYNGMQPQEKMKNRVRYRLIHPLPPYLMFHIKRFSKNKFVSERNPTIVTFPVRSLDMAPYVEPNPKIYPPGEPIWYDLVANITHEAVKKNDDSVEGEQETKVWRVQLKDRSRDEWVGVQDLFVEKERGETLFTKESYAQVWERRRGAATTNGKGKGRA
jgi:U4/U6.U5 tri-snRNP-associated protein 2